MSIFDVTATNSSGGSGETPPEGNQPAVLVGLIDLGWHEEDFQGKQYDARKILFVWELTAEHQSNGKSYFMSRDFNLMEKMGAKSALRKTLECWRGKPMADGEHLDLAALLGKPCLINVGHKQSAKNNTYAIILGISQVPKGMTVPRPLTELLAWDMDSGLPYPNPEWVPYLYGRPVMEVINEGVAYSARRKTKPEPALVGAGAPSGSNGAGVVMIEDSDTPF